MTSIARSVVYTGCALLMYATPLPAASPAALTSLLAGGGVRADTDKSTPRQTSFFRLFLLVRHFFRPSPLQTINSCLRTPDNPTRSMRFFPAIFCSSPFFFGHHVSKLTSSVCFFHFFFFFRPSLLQTNCLRTFSSPCAWMPLVNNHKRSW